MTEASASVCRLPAMAMKTHLWFNVFNFIYIIGFSDALTLSPTAVRNVNYKPLEDPYLILKRVVYFNIQSVHHNLAIFLHAVDQQACSRSHAWFGLDIKWSLGGTGWYNRRTCFYCHSTCQHLIAQTKKTNKRTKHSVLIFDIPQPLLVFSKLGQFKAMYIWLRWTTVAPWLKSLVSLAT